MNPADDLLRSAVYNADVIALKKAISQSAYEEKIIKDILMHVGLDKEVGKLCMRVKEKTGRGRLTFEWFYEEYPHFPIYLAMRKIPFAFKVGAKDLFNKFTGTPMYTEWENFCDEAPVEDKPIGIVFDWPGVKGTQMIIHNDQQTMLQNDTGVRIVRRVGRGSATQPVIIEQLDNYLTPALARWVP
jgi:hypothetical protein